MRIEPKQAFYNEETGAVQPWKDIEVTDAVGNELVAEGLVTEIEGGGGGGGEIPTATVTFINSAENTHYLAYPVHLVDGVITVESVQVETSVDVQIPLGENGTILSMEMEDVDLRTMPTYTGDIELALNDEDEPIGFKVTGDGTFTFKGTGH